MRVETARPIRLYRIWRRGDDPQREINRDCQFPGADGPAPRTPQLAPCEGFGPERPSPGPAGSCRPSRQRSRGRPRTTGNREERVGRTDPAGPASIGAVGEPGLVRIRTVPAEVRGNELEAARPFGLGPHEEDPAGRQSGAPVPGPLLPIR